MFMNYGVDSANDWEIRGVRKKEGFSGRLTLRLAKFGPRSENSKGHIEGLENEVENHAEEGWYEAIEEI